MSRFSREVKLTAASLQGVQPGDLEADHIVPKSKGGSNDITNLQFTTKDANRKKSNNEFVAWNWQKAFSEKWDNADKDKPFLCCAVPAGGKTLASLWVAHRWMLEGRGRKLVVVVPYSNLKDQWMNEAAKWFGIQLKPDEIKVRTRDFFHGYVITYQGLGSSAQFFKQFCYDNETMVIFDEIHHCSMITPWGEKVKHAFSDNQRHIVRKLLLTGTAYRSDGACIPFVRYEKGYSALDFHYTRGAALEDNKIRWVNFHLEGGAYSGGYNGDVKKYVVDLDLEDSESEDIILTRLLNPKGEYVKKLLYMSHNKLMELRQNVPDAAGIVICHSIWHARDVAKILEGITGKKPSVIVGRALNNNLADGDEKYVAEDICNDTVDGFRKAKNEWVVSVRQISEGTDIKRLQVLCYLTNATTRLHFVQSVGRVQRRRDENNEYDSECYVYLPAHPRFHLNAKEIDEAQILSNVPPSPSPPPRRDGDDPPPPVDLWTFVDSSHTGTQMVMINNRSYTKQEAEIIAGLARKENMTQERAAAAYDHFKSCGLTLYGGSEVKEEHDVKPLATQLKDLRKYNHQLVRQISKRWESMGRKKEYNLIHIAANKAVGEYNQDKMSIAQLEKKKAYLLKEIDNVKRYYNERYKK